MLRSGVVHLGKNAELCFLGYEHAAWRTSSRSNDGGDGGCVEVAEPPGRIALRDSKNPTGHILTFPAPGGAPSSPPSKPPSSPDFDDVAVEVGDRPTGQWSGQYGLRRDDGVAGDAVAVQHGAVGCAHGVTAY